MIKIIVAIATKVDSLTFENNKLQIEPIKPRFIKPKL